MPEYQAHVDQACPSIRSVTREELLRRCNPEQSGQPKTSNAIEASSPALSLVADSDGRIVGCVQLDGRAHQIGLIHGFWVASEFWGTALPLRMMIAVLEEAKQIGFLKVDLDESATAFAVVAALFEAGILLEGRPVSTKNETTTGCLNLYQSTESILES